MLYKGSLTSIVAALLVTLGLASVAQAEVTPITDGYIDWGVKASFNAYAGGGVPSGGAIRNPADDAFRFPITSGSFDSDTNTTIARTQGSVRWAHYCGGSGPEELCALDMTITDPWIELSPAGAEIYFREVRSRHHDNGQMIVYPNANLARPNISSVEPTFADGVTTWASIPSVLTAMGVAPFAGFYVPGQVLDPVTLVYEGPGGKPIPEPWTAPGTPIYAASDPISPAGAIAGGVRRVYPDDDHGIFHVVSRIAGGVTRVQAYDNSTREPVGPESDVPDTGTLSEHSTAFDPELGTVFVASRNGDTTSVVSLDRQDGAYVQETLVVGAAGSQRAFERMVYNPVTKRLHGFPALPSQATPGFVVARSGDGWGTVRSSAWPFSAGRNLHEAVVTTDGQIVAGTSAVGPTGPAPFVSLRVSEFGGITATPVSGQNAIPPSFDAAALGFVNAAPGPDGSAYLLENTVPGRFLKVRRTVDDEWVVGGSPVATNRPTTSIAVDRDDETVYVGSRQAGPDAPRLSVLREGREMTSIALQDDPRQLAVGDSGTVYVNTGSQVVVIDREGASPRVTTQPQDAAVTVPSADASTNATFTAVAEGSPEPAVRWQRLVPGEGWRDLPDATGTTLTVAATVALTGSRYRAVFSNPAGEIASGVAEVTVAVRPSDVPGPGTPGPPSPKPNPPSPPAATPTPSTPRPKVLRLRLTPTRLTFRLADADRARVLVQRQQARRVRRNDRTRTIRSWRTIRAQRLRVAGSQAVTRRLRRLPAGRYRLTVTPIAEDGRAGRPRTTQALVRPAKAGASRLR